MHIILTPAQAAAVAGDYAHAHRLEPRLMLDGNYCLPGSVLDTAALAEAHPALIDLPRREVGPDDFPATDDA